MVSKLLEVEDVTVERFINEGFLLDIETAKQNFTELFRGVVPGIYCFLDINGRPLYLGKSIRLNERLNSHFRGQSSPTKHILDAIHYVKILPVRCRDHRLYVLERLLIEGIKPLFNGHARGTEITYGYKNLRSWFNEYIKTSKVIEEDIIQDRIITFIDEGDGEVVVIDTNSTTTSINDEPLIEVGIDKLREMFEVERQYKNGDLPKEKDYENTSSISGCTKNVIREAIKMLVKNCPPSKELDHVIDGLMLANP